MLLAASSAAALALALARPDPPARLPVLDSGRFAVDATGAATNGQEVKVDPAPRRLLLAILPDRTTGRAWGLPYLRSAVDDLSRIRPDAIFTVGDMVQGYTRDESQWDREANEYIDIVRPLGASLFPTAGNHDVISGSRDPTDRRFAERYRHRFGPLWYSVELDLATVLILFSDDASADRSVQMSSEQLAWLEGALTRAAARGRPIILLMHRPLWRYDSAQWSTKVAPLLKRAGADVVIAGHFHSLQRDHDIDGVEYHIVGTCGGMIDQHPLAGQLQHLTFLEIDADGSTHLWHQPVGMTLPDDFVLRDDQDRVWSLTNTKGLLRWTGAIADPWPDGSRGAATLEVRNPTDVPIHVSVELVRGEAVPAPVPDLAWRSFTPIDARNRFVTDANSPFEIDAVAPIMIAPGATGSFSISGRCPRTSEVPRAPELRLTASFRDAHGRDVPVWLRTTLPLDRTLEIDGRPVPLQALEPSPYDVLEPDPTVRVEAEPNGGLTFEVSIDDPVRPDDVTLVPSGRERITNPLHDAIRLQLAHGEEFFVEPFRTDATVQAVHGDALVPTSAVTLAVDDSAPVARVRLTLAPDVAAQVRAPGGGVTLGVADNDRTYHTQWRWLMPTGRWARVAERPSSPSSPRNSATPPATAPGS